MSVCGEPALAYLVHRPGHSGNQLRVAPIYFDPESGSPHAHEVDSRLLASDCPSTSPVIAPNGGWITVLRSDGPKLRAERIAIQGRPTTDLTNSDRCLWRRVLRQYASAHYDRRSQESLS